MSARRPAARYRVRNGAGEELVVPSLDVLATLYRDGFVADDDLVRPERDERWVRAGAMPALHGVRERAADPKRVALLVAAAVALATAVGVLLAR